VTARLPVRVERMRDAHAAAVLAVYADGIATGDATFETDVPTWPEFVAGHIPDHGLVAVDPTRDEVVGWAATSAVSGRCVYAGVHEVSVYVAAAATGRGVGRALLDGLVASTEAAGVWTLQAGIFPENVASLRLHAACGFRVVGTRERLGRLRGTWRDVVLVERRSPVVG
jgi:L-amino acid N-acyltransferase YncA